MSRQLDWCYTLNNYSEAERDAHRAFDCVYHVFGYERGDSGTPHLQGYIRFSSVKSLKQLKKLMPRAHLEPRKGPLDRAIDYCMKEGDYEEFGVKPKTSKQKGEAEKDRWRLINMKAAEGDEEWLREHEPQLYHNRLSTFRSHKKQKAVILDYHDEDTPHEWWVGPTGTGKSRAAHERFPGHYQKQKNKWWCGYNGQDTVVIEEADPKSMEHLADRMKVWADRYPFPGEIKGGRLEGLRPLKVIVTSNYHPEACFPNPNDLEPIMRRFKVVRFGVPTAVHKDYNI